METVIPFRAWRYDTSKAGALDQLVAPPYDVVDTSLQSRLYARSPHNVIRVDLGMTTPSDNDCDNRYTRAATQLMDWKRDGVLVRDAGPSITFVQESFTGPDGRERSRHGFLALLRLHEFEDEVVFPHERTLSGPKEDRFRLLQATGMSLSPVFLLYDLPGDEITKAWQAGPGSADPAHVVVDPEGGPQATRTSLWPVADGDLTSMIRRTLAGSRFVIADGHHRYETALRYRRYRREAAGDTSGRSTVRTPAAYDYVLAYLANMSDPALAIFGTHRLVKGVAAETVAELPRSLSGTFDVQLLALAESGTAGAAAARTAIEGYLEAHPRHAFGMWGPSLDGAYGIRLTDPGAVREIEPDATDAYRDLDVTILQALVLQKTLGITAGDMASETHVTFFKDPNDAFARLVSGEFQVGFFMNPTGLDQTREVAFGGERMPQKATFFYPKLPTGLVFHDLDSDL